MHKIVVGFPEIEFPSVLMVAVISHVNIFYLTKQDIHFTLIQLFLLPSGNICIELIVLNSFMWYTSFEVLMYVC